MTIANTSDQLHAGSCLCGGITFQVKGVLPNPDACHCIQCRKHSGHFGAGIDIDRQALTISGEELLTWYRSDKARRGFCSVCGSSLFFDPYGRDWIGIHMGAFDTPTNTKIRIHIFTQNKGDYYELSDGIPQHLAYPGGPAPSSG